MTANFFTRFKAWRKGVTLAQAYQRVFDSPEGELVLRDLLRKSGLLEVSHEPGDPYHTAYRDGRRSMGLEILEQIRWTEPELVRLAAEQTADSLQMREEVADAAHTEG